MPAEAVVLPKLRPQALRQRVAIWALLFLLCLAFAGWAYVLMRLTSASREGVDAFENRIRNALVHRGYLPRTYRHWTPDHQDLIKHFVFYAPFGLMAGLAATVVRLSPRGTFPQCVTTRRIAIGLLMLGVTLSAADELRQVWIPSRSAEFLDLFAGWGGIATAFLLWTLAERGALLATSRRVIQTIRSSPHHRPNGKGAS